MGEPLLCPKCKDGNMKWIGDIDADDLLENGLMECKNPNCKARYKGIKGFQFAWNDVIKHFCGEAVGVTLKCRGKNDPHICFQLFGEDDGRWFPTDGVWSSSWIDDLIEQLKLAKEFIETQEPDIEDGRQYGYKFKKETI